MQRPAQAQGVNKSCRSMARGVGQLTSLCMPVDRSNRWLKEPTNQWIWRHFSTSSK